ncbi:MAG: N-acetylmuramoyl-L-alanine amidase [Minisyncoccia bacterium]|jgi:N-acetyl-anhydromuramyl-L-alanine amidase AmpD
MIPRKNTDTLVIHCAATKPSMDIGVDEITQWHKDRGFDTIGYHYVIRRSGVVEKGREDSLQGAHAVAVNGTSIGVCMVGGVDDSLKWENNFTEAQFRSLKSLIILLKNKYPIEKIIGHYEVESKKECPSFNVQEWLDNNDLA